MARGLIFPCCTRPFGIACGNKSPAGEEIIAVIGRRSTMSLLGQKRRFDRSPLTSGPRRPWKAFNDGSLTS
jgi:hypothetical protein